MRVFRKAYRDIAVCRHERKKNNTETEPILRLVLPTGGGPSNNIKIIHKINYVVSTNHAAFNIHLRCSLHRLIADMIIYSI